MKSRVVTPALASRERERKRESDYILTSEREIKRTHQTEGIWNREIRGRKGLASI